MRGVRIAIHEGIEESALPVRNRRELAGHRGRKLREMAERTIRPKPKTVAPVRRAGSRSAVRETGV